MNGDMIMSYDNFPKVLRTINDLVNNFPNEEMIDIDLKCVEVNKETLEKALDYVQSQFCRITYKEEIKEENGFFEVLDFLGFETPSSKNISPPVLENLKEYQSFSLYDSAEVNTVVNYLCHLNKEYEERIKKPIYFFAAAGNILCLKHLLDTEESHKNDRVVLHLAIFFGQKEIVDELYLSDTQFNHSLAILATIVGHVNILDLIIRENIESFYKCPLLYWAAFMGQEEVLDYLLSKGFREPANPQEKIISGPLISRSPSSIAMSWSHLGCVKKLYQVHSKLNGQWLEMVDGSRILNTIPLRKDTRECVEFVCQHGGKFPESSLLASFLCNSILDKDIEGLKFFFDKGNVRTIYQPHLLDKILTLVDYIAYNKKEIDMDRLDTNLDEFLRKIIEKNYPLIAMPKLYRLVIRLDLVNSYTRINQMYYLHSDDSLEYGLTYIIENDSIKCFKELTNKYGVHMITGQGDSLIPEKTAPRCAEYQKEYLKTPHFIPKKKT